MTLLAIIQKVMPKLQLGIPSTVIGNTDNNVVLAKTMLEETLDKLAREYPWTELQNEYTFTLSTGVASYVLPPYFDSLLSETLWNRSQVRSILGPVSPQTWQQIQSGTVVPIPSERFRVKGWSDKQFFITPTPTSSENGQTCALEYISAINRRPKTWIATTSWAGNAYCSYNGNVYGRGSTGAGSTGTSPPVQVTSTPTSDGSLTWTYLATPFVTFTNDSDEVILDNQIIEEGTIWRWKREKGYDFAGLQEENERQIQFAKTKFNPPATISARAPSNDAPMINEDDYPEGNYGS